VAGQDLARCLVEAELDPGVGLADGADPGPAGTVGGGHGAVLGHAVDLVDDHPDPVEPLEQLGSDRRRPRPREAAALQAEPFAQGPVQERVAEGVAQPGRAGVGAAVGHQLGPDPGRLAHPQPVVGPFQRGRRGHPDLDRGPDLLPDAGHGEEQGRLDLAQVVLDGLDRLGEVDLGAGGGVLPLGGDPLGHVAQRQVGQGDVVGAGILEEAVVVDEDLDGEVDVGHGQHGPLGRPGGPRGVDEGDHVVGRHLGGPLVQQPGVPPAVVAAKREQLGP